LFIGQTAECHAAGIPSSITKRAKRAIPGKVRGILGSARPSDQLQAVHVRQVRRAQMITRLPTIVMTRLLAAASCFLTFALAGCASSASAPAVTPHVKLATASLPLQKHGLAYGGDAEAQATDTVAAAITPAELDDIENQCQDTVEIQPVKDCMVAYLLIDPQPCLQDDLCIHAYNVPSADLAWVVEVRDDRPGASLCASDPHHVCIRAGETSGSVLDQQLQAQGDGSNTGTTSTDSPSETTSPSDDPSTSTSPTEDPSSSTSVTNDPATSQPETGPATTVPDTAAGTGTPTP
jgi:hypothetical protein